VEYSGVLRLEASLLHQRATPLDTEREATLPTGRTQTGVGGNIGSINKLSWYGHDSLNV
jgi:hypothetical protein